MTWKCVNKPDDVNDRDQREDRRRKPSKRFRAVHDCFPFRLEFVARAKTNRSRTSRHDQCARAAATGCSATEIDAFVEQIFDESLNVPFRPIEPSVKVDQSGCVKPSLELVGIHDLADCRTAGSPFEATMEHTRDKSPNPVRAPLRRPSRPAITCSACRLELGGERQTRSAWGRDEVLKIIADVNHARAIRSRVTRDRADIPAWFSRRCRRRPHSRSARPGHS